MTGKLGRVRIVRKKVIIVSQAKALAHFVLERWIAVFGCPQILFVDPDKRFSTEENVTTVGSSRVGCDFLKKVQFLHMRVKVSFYHTITFPDNTFGQVNPFATNLLRLKAKKSIF